LRGGISVALALSLYDIVRKYGVNHEIIDIIIAMTYSVVVFSIIVQGLTMKKVFDMIPPPEGTEDKTAKPAEAGSVE
jgi:CPA1 family monovalent cation:H+ antiporter